MRKFHVNPNIPSADAQLTAVIESLKRLTNEPITEEWFIKMSDLQCLFNDAWLAAFWKTNQDTGSKELEQNFNNVTENFVPKFEEVFATLTEMVTQSPPRSPRFAHIAKRMRSGTFESSETIELSKRISSLSNEYDRLVSKQTVELGEGTPLTAAEKLLQLERDKDKRRAIWSKIQERKLADALRVQELMQELVALRREIAKLSGVADFRAYCWELKERHDYTADDNLNLLTLVEDAFADSYARIAALQMKNLGLTEYKPWDVVAPIAAPEIERVLSERQYLELLQKAFHMIDPAFGDVVEMMIGHGHVDLNSRTNKVAYNFCGSFMSVNEQVVSCNLSGAPHQLSIAFHEFGHAMHHHCIHPGKLFFEKGGPDEVNEFVATTFQLLGSELLEQLGFSPEEAQHYRLAMIVNKLKLAREYTALDRLQHWIFTREGEPTIEEIDEAFRDITANHPEDWSGYENYRAQGWHSDHVISTPFYTVEYVISWVGALIFFNRYKNGALGIENLKEMMRLGNTTDTRTSFGTLNIQFPFGSTEIHEARLGLEYLLGHLLK
jgi:oligoendopeptidase F